MSLSFSAGTDKALHGDVPSMDGAAAYTWMLWIKIVALPPDAVPGGILAKSVGTHTIVMRARDVLLDIFMAAGLSTWSSFLSADSWAHVAVVYDGSLVTDAAKLKVFKDGTQRTGSMGTVPATLSDSGAAELTIGYHASAGGGISAKVAHLKCWSVALTAAEVAGEMNSRRPARTANLVIWVPYDDAVNARNYSGSGSNHGTVSGTTAIQVADSPPVSAGGGPGIFAV